MSLKRPPHVQVAWQLAVEMHDNVEPAAAVWSLVHVVDLALASVEVPASSEGPGVEVCVPGDCQFAASCRHLKADFRRVMPPRHLQPHAATSRVYALRIKGL